ncbi:hypothetical protein [Burkholderia multivorans]|uniref:hypothetical protein n=1 Tax=Burkholderia multivorans TaxID=87883 RepID=UPI001C24EF63|nr:hypothetical protein [Burkholderia multivorans]MBU9220136.1 hypothetical protein [Burkholderia multivorans]MBU9417951.1 hypothetical protein [Burkholderia multivorans]
MRELPILFSGPMVRAILEGRKTQTQRIAIPKRSCIDFIGGGPKDGPDWNDPACWGFEDANTGIWWALRGDNQCRQLPCPHGEPGDRLWVRETCSADELDSGLDGVRYPAMARSARSKIRARQPAAGSSCTGTAARPVRRCQRSTCRAGRRASRLR